MIAGKKAEGLSAGLAADVEDIGGEAEGGWGDEADLGLDEDGEGRDEFEDAEAGDEEGDGGAQRHIRAHHQDRRGHAEAGQGGEDDQEPPTGEAWHWH